MAKIMEEQIMDFINSFGNDCTQREEGLKNLFVDLLTHIKILEENQSEAWKNYDMMAENYKIMAEAFNKLSTEYKEATKHSEETEKKLNRLLKS